MSWSPKPRPTPSAAPNAARLVASTPTRVQREHRADEEDQVARERARRRNERLSRGGCARAAARRPACASAGSDERRGEDPDEDEQARHRDVRLPDVEEGVIQEVHAGKDCRFRADPGAVRCRLQRGYAVARALIRPIAAIRPTRHGFPAAPSPRRHLAAPTGRVVGPIRRPLRGVQRGEGSPVLLDAAYFAGSTAPTRTGRPARRPDRTPRSPRRPCRAAPQRRCPCRKRG